MKKAGIFIVILALCVLLTACGEQKAYDEACALFEKGRYAEAIEMFRALGDYSDSSDRIRIAETRLAQTSTHVDTDKAESDRALKYADAFTYLESGRTREAYAAFSSLGSYRDAAEQLQRFTVVRGALTGEEIHVIRDGEDTLRGSAVYSYGADGRALTRSGFCRLEKYGWFEDFDYHYTYDQAGNVSHIDAISRSGALNFSIEYSYSENGRPIHEFYSDSFGTTREFIRSYTYRDVTDSTGSYTEVVESELFNGNAFPLESWQESYCEFGVSTMKCDSSTTVNHYAADGKRLDTVETLADGSKYVTTYSYGDVYLYTPAA